MNIESGIPLPRPSMKGNEQIHQMKPGDSVLCPTQQKANNVWMLGKRKGWKMATRKLEAGWRVWRTE